MKITLHNISFAYDHEAIIKDLSCSFVPGNFYSIIGPNGSGKTTLLDLISGFLAPCKGHVDIDQRRIPAWSKTEIARKIALVSQDYAINFPFFVKEVVMMGRHPYIPRFSPPSKKDIKKANKIMMQCGIQHLQNRKINELSGGEKQRCVFARALCQDTPILLLDEAFSSMDIHHTLQMLHLIKQAVKNKNKLVINVFHDLNLASSWSDVLLILKQGRIKAFGRSGDVLTQPIIKEVFNVDSIIEYNEHVQAKQVYYPPV
ncbi:MAG: ABC transporter ATP-binding protein [Deltaproteobacteria bacterium]|nr:ABC transporter ATP-binding protein [Deltaproteobacteria bacterium]